MTAPPARFALAAILILMLTGRAPAVDNSLVAHYQFTEGSGDRLRDSSGNENHAALHGATWVRTDGGFALAFDGEDDYADCGSGDAFELTGPFTIELWMQAQELPVGEALLAGRDYGSYALTYSGAAYPGRVFLHVADVRKKCRARAVAGIWHHIVAAFDGTSLRVYVDGALAGGVRVWKHKPGPKRGRFTLGGGADGFNHFKGLLNDVRVYRRALSRDEAFTRYREGRPRHPNAPPPRRPWRGKGVRRLNNLVAELLNIRYFRNRPGGTYEFENPRDGWVFASVTAAKGKDAKVRLSFGGATGDGGPAFPEMDARPAEAMRFLPRGVRTLTVSTKGDVRLKRLIVRAIPTLVYGAFPTTPRVKEFGAYDRERLEEDILRNVNVLVGLPTDEIVPFVQEWKRAGKRWIAEHSAPWYDYSTKRQSVTTDDFYRVLTQKPGMQHPLMDGVLLDTHDVGHNKRYTAYAEAVQRVRDDPQFDGKKLHLYCDCLFGASASQAFARKVLECGYRLIWTRYLHEQPSEEMARSFIEASLADEAVGWERSIPGSVERMIMALGYLTSPGERMNIEPGVNYFVFMDMQCHLLANHPAFRGLGGVMWYKSHYANEEPLRWGGRLFRHYFIEGNTEMLSTEPYALPHLQNPDFNDGAEGWTLSPAEAGSMEARHLDRYGFAQGRWLETGAGDHFLWMRRSAKQPNRIEQEVNDLEPGRLYSLKVFSADHKALIESKTSEETHALSIRVEDADIIPGKSFTNVYPNFSYYHLGPYDDEAAKSRTWMNFRYIVFRAKAETARLTISDWAAADAPGGPAGQELSLNFIELQPYLE